MVDTSFYQNKGPFTLSKVAEITGSELAEQSKANELISDIATMEKAGADDICFFYDKKAKEAAQNIKAKACITTKALADFIPAGIIVLLNDNPKIAFLKLNTAMYAEFEPSTNISIKASIHPSAKIGQNCFIGDFVSIEEGVVIGDNCRIEAGAYIGRACKIGNNCRIGSNAYIAYAIIGNDCYIYTGARIGADGFGFDLIEGKHQRIPQIGRVIIGNDVEIGANTCVDRGALDDTVIGDGCRIDNLVQIAHNDKLGRGCVVVSQVGIAGSCTFGDYVVCGGQTGFADHLKIGTGAQIAAQSGVMRDVEPGAVLLGTPAVPFKDFMRQVAFLQKNSKK
ncbi:MAG TPA: UDP-3-O-(3-hydroxymyristoyl)glucosamine N-acyltransferase [Alphaproteobacteria bacterium]|nr:UDP-3-O-(3-hydroxymyristoyl)glucosamine N-acyltransferase [Alphaproteobacteria bacterium]